MCTQARSPSPSRATEIASSKSFAVSGSMVNAVSSRRSTRPSSDGSGRSWGSNAVRAPRGRAAPRGRRRCRRRGRGCARAGRGRARSGRRRGRPGARRRCPFRSSTAVPRRRRGHRRRACPASRSPRLRSPPARAGERTAWRYSSVAIAVSSASSSAVLGSSTTSTSGRRPRREMSVPLGVTYRAVVSFSAPRSAAARSTGRAPCRRCARRRGRRARCRAGRPRRPPRRWPCSG